MFKVKVLVETDLRTLSPEAAEFFWIKYRWWCSPTGTLSMTGTAEEMDSFLQDVYQFQPESRRLLAGLGGAGGTITVPAVQYDHLSKSYKRELEQIKSDNRVEMEAVVSVSFKPGKEGQAMVERAQNDFIRLVHKIAPKLGGIQIPDASLRDSTGTLSCTLLNPKQTERVKAVFGQIRERHPNIATGEKYRDWKLIGLPEHLGPAVRDVEQKLGGPAFKEGVRLRRRLGGCSLEPPGQQEEEQEAVRGGHGAEGETHNPEDRCPICLDAFQKKMALQCKHEFCEGCLKEAVRVSGAVCPVCKDVFRKVEGNQPPGRMRHTKSATSLPGFPHCGSIWIDYEIPNGIQTDKHPKPGRRFIGTSRTAYLPDSPEGNEVLGLLQKAFDQNLIFTVGTSRTIGSEDTVTWNDIHHKTNMHGGPQRFGYPDPDYLKRVKEELKAKGIK